MTSTFWSNIVRGVALADAYGDGNEFQSIQSLTATNPQGPEMPQDLRITDDTQMTLYLARALDESWGQDMDTVKRAIMDRFLDYNKDPDNNRAPGMTVTSSLNRLGRLDYDWKTATSSTSDGSGTVMRTSPCAFLPADQWVGITAFAAAVTHGTPNAVAAAILNVALLRELMRGEVKAGELVSHGLVLASDPDTYGLTDLSVIEWLAGFTFANDGTIEDGFDELARLLQAILPEVVIAQNDPWALGSDPSHWAKMGGGWRAHETLVIALACVDMLPTDPMAALRRSVTTDGDSDTIGAVAGGLLGAAFPNFFIDLWNQGLRDRFEKRYREEIEEVADNYCFEDPKSAVQWVNGTPTRRGYFRRLGGGCSSEQVH
jgi:ADP-ribosylglycohydrolase